PKSTKTITFSYTFDKYAPNGTYYVRVSLKNVENREIDERGPIQLKLKGVVKLPTECTKKEVRYGLLTTEVLIEVKNEGNVPSGQFIVTESLPLIAKSFFIPEIEPDFENVVDGRIIYGWKVNNLEPGVSVVIRYKIFVVHFWVLILSIGLLLIYFFHMMFGLSIKKISPYKGPIVREKPIKIMINIKNKSSRQIKNVRVKDFVPAILKVLKKFDTLVPKIKREKDGTKLEWKIYALKPKEERIITYYVQPIVDIVGSIKLPEVIIEYKERNKKKIVKSRKSLIKSKIEEE
ncbi:MAG: hypothetical protein J7L39_03005, partial [Candidatus Aenigmarchaeota archaeon]|nr:hypothetical protein [Candidatus Aenigmarchaeota archaeon]